jgi:glycosyltransferase involved in cell wall biosynthesis
LFGLRGLHPDLEISGFETAFAEIAPRLAARGHDVVLYGRAGAHSPGRRPPREEGVALEYLPSPGGKNLSAVSSTLFAVGHALVRRRHDVWCFVNVGMGHHVALARLSGRPVVINVDGLDWTRGKWGPVARAYFYTAAHSAMRFATRVVTDAEAMRVYYRERFDCDTVMIAYGAHIERPEHPELLAPIAVRPREYYLIVTRLIPENTLDVMLEGFSRSRTARPLVVVGGANYRDGFHARLRDVAAASGGRITLLGHLSDQALIKELRCNCYAYLHGHSVGGTNPSLLNAMGSGACVLARDTVFNREVLGDAGLFFDPVPSAVAALVNRVDGDVDLVARYRRAAPHRIAERYTWEGITDQYEALFRSVIPRARVTH